MQAARLDARDLACRRGDRVLFSGLSFSLAPGDALQIAGANGIGKSSLIRLLAGLARPYAGTVERDGAIALVDERLALDSALPLGRTLDFWARMDGVCESALAGHATTLGLARLLDVPVRYLSTGQKKRAALARLLGQNAAIWLLDEPLNGLDTQACTLVARLTEAHCANGGIAIIASHQSFGLAGLMALDLMGFAA